MKTLIASASLITILSGIFLLIGSELWYASAALAVGMWGLFSIRHYSASDRIIDEDISAPPAKELKQFREAHPELSFSEAVVAYRDKR